MDTYNPFLLRLMFGMQKACKNSRTAVFSTRTTEITKALQRHTVPEALDEVARLAQDWSGGTDMGGALAHLNRVVLGQGAARSTVGVIISDGYDQGNPETVRKEMRMLHRRTRSILWINPLIGTEGYAPVARGMAAALPYVDYFLPANDMPTLRTLCRHEQSISVDCAIRPLVHRYAVLIEGQRRERFQFSRDFVDLLKQRFIPR